MLDAGTHSLFTTWTIQLFLGFTKMTNDINARQAGMKESRMEEEYHCFGCFRFYCDIMGKDIGRLRPVYCFWHYWAGNMKD